MHWDGTITLGNVFTVIAFLFGLWGAASRTFHTLDKRAVIFEKTIQDHALLLDGHAKRMEKQDQALTMIMGEIQRILGRLDTWQSVDWENRVRQRAGVDGSAAKL